MHRHTEGRIPVFLVIRHRQECPARGNRDRILPLKDGEARSATFRAVAQPTPDPRIPTIERPLGAVSGGKVQLLAAVAEGGVKRAKDPTAATLRTNG